MRAACFRRYHTLPKSCDDMCRCGSGQSSLQLGIAYYKGKPAGITRDYEKAFKFFSRAAEGGSSPDALYYMGIMLLRGQGSKGDPARAADCFQRAAEAGHVLAQYQLATLYCSPLLLVREHVIVCCADTAPATAKESACKPTTKRPWRCSR